MYNETPSREEHERQQEEEFHQYMSDLYERVKKYTPNLTIELFNDIINQPDFDIEGYVISKNIQIEEDKEFIRRFGKNWKTELWLKWLRT